MSETMPFSFTTDAVATEEGDERVHPSGARATVSAEAAGKIAAMLRALEETGAEKMEGRVAGVTIEWSYLALEPARHYWRPAITPEEQAAIARLSSSPVSVEVAAHDLYGDRTATLTFVQFDPDGIAAESGTTSAPIDDMLRHFGLTNPFASVPAAPEPQA